MEHKGILGTFYGLIYFLEGILLAYFTGFNIIYLRSFDLSYTTIGVINSIALAPFILKIFIGLFSDSVNLFGLGHRKPLIITGLILETVAVCLMPFLFDPIGSVVLSTTILFLIALGMSIFDTATDGYALDSTPPDNRGFVQGIMVGGRSVGMVVAAVCIGFITNYYSWSWVFFGIAAASLIPVVCFLLVPAEKPRTEKARFAFSAFKSFLTLPILFFCLASFLYPLVIYNVEGIANPFLKEGLALSMINVGLLTALFGIGAGVGAIFGGLFTDRIGHRNSLIIAMLVSTATILPIAAINHLAMAYALLSLFGVAFGYYETVYFSLSMDFADPRIAATMFAVFMALGNFGIAAGQPLAGALVDSIGFRLTFVIFAGINILVLPMAPIIFRKEKKKS